MNDGRADLQAVLRESLAGLLSELLHGPAGDAAFIVNPGDTGMLGSLAQLSAAQASERPGGRSSVAAHVGHLRYGLELLNRWAAGDDDAFAGAEYARSWEAQQVADGEWQSLQRRLAQEAQAWTAAIERRVEWDRVSLSGAISSLAHLAYHLGAIRQLVAAAAGPRAAD